MREPERVPVLIVGGGIVGLTASLFLSHHGIRSLLVERRASTSVHPRSRSVNARTMELYRALGLSEKIRAVGADLNPSGGIYRATSLAKVIEPQKRSRQGATEGMPGGGIVRTIGPEVATRGTQDLIEPVLLAAAQEQQCADLQFNTECVALQQSDSDVSVTVRERTSGNTSTIQAEYVLAADGAGSQIRQMLDIKTTGRGVLGHLLNILFEADLRELVRGREFSLCSIVRPELHGLFTSINNSDRWVFHLSYDPEKGEKAEDYTADRCISLIKAALGLSDVEIRIESTLPWKSAVRVAETFQQGRVFLMGDAAHQMPPWGGQGANSGIADAHNLAWKLAAVLRGQATPDLLATYNEERLPVGRLAAEESGAAADEYGLLATSWAALFRLLLRSPRILGYGYRYLSQAVIPDDSSFQFLRIPWFPVAWLLDLIGNPGTRCPHMWVQRQHQDGEQRLSTLDLCNAHFVLLAGSDGGAWREAASTVSKSLDIKLAVHCVGEHPSNDLLATERRWESVAGISSNGALLIRPDGFVAWRAYRQPADLGRKLDDVLKRVLCLP